MLGILGIVVFTMNACGIASVRNPAGTPTVASLVSTEHDLRDKLQDGSLGPSLAVVPAGSFIMGSPESEVGRYTDESPQHGVTFARAFAAGKTEVSVGEFRRFIETSGYRTDAEKGSGSFFRDPEDGAWRLDERLNWRYTSYGETAADNLPVVHVSWNDAQAYVQWLSQQTGKHYRLPSEAELEYVNRAGSTTIFAWGNGAPTEKIANVKGEKDRPYTGDRVWEPTEGEHIYAFSDGATPLYFEGYQDGYGQPAPVASFPANAFGIYDTTGNVWEWAQDCWHGNYEHAPTDGSAWDDIGNCGQRVVRGGSWYCFPRHVRAANRWRNFPIFRNMYVGFRVARDL